MSDTNSITDTAADVAKGATALADTDVVYNEIIEYIGNETEAVQALSAPIEFFQKGWDLLHGDTGGKSTYEILEGQPEYVAQIEDQWAAGVAAIKGYAERSNTPVPDSVIQWMGNMEDGWSQAKKLEAVQEKLNKLGDMLTMAKPFARMAGIAV